jgi:hypothetical protein
LQNVSPDINSQGVPHLPPASKANVAHLNNWQWAMGKNVSPDINSQGVPHLPQRRKQMWHTSTIGNGQWAKMQQAIVRKLLPVVY